MDIVYGYGVVGQATALVLSTPYFFDPFKKGSVSLRRLEPNSAFYVCVPTPTVEGKQDISVVEEAVVKIKKHCKNPLIVIRSTVLPGTCRKLQKKHNIPIYHAPEFLTESTALHDALSPEFVVVGGDNLIDRSSIAHKLAGNSTKIINVSLETAEMIKYSMNTFFATKVVLGNVLRDVAVSVGADYNKVMWCLENHKFGSKNGWNPFYGSKRGFGGKCLPKDVEALSSLDETRFLEVLLMINNSYRKSG